MLCGKSTAHGVLLYDESLKGTNGVLCLHRDGQIHFENGDYKELEQKLNDDDVTHNLRILLLFLCFGGVYAAALYGLFRGLVIHSCGFFPLLGAGVLAVTTFIPAILVSLLPLFRWFYTSADAFHQYRRHHAAEHMIINYTEDGKPQGQLDTLRKASRINGRCSSAMESMKITVFIMISAAIGMLPILITLNFWQILGLAALAVLLLVVNPIGIVQWSITEKPTDTELMMVMEGMNRLQAMRS